MLIFSSAGSRKPWTHCALVRLRESEARTAIGSGLPGKSVMVAMMRPSVSVTSSLTVPMKKGAVSPRRTATRRPIATPRDEVWGRCTRTAPSISSTTAHGSTV